MDSNPETPGEGGSGPSSSLTRGCPVLLAGASVGPGLESGRWAFKSFWLLTSPSNLTGLPWWLRHGKVSACNVVDPCSIPGLERSPGERNGYPLQYSCLENPMDRGAWWAVVHGVIEVDTTERLTLSLFCLTSDAFLIFQFQVQLQKQFSERHEDSGPAVPHPTLARPIPSSLLPSATVPSCPFAGGAGRSAWEPAA